MDNTYNIDFIARCIAGHNKTAIKSITTELENVQKQVGGVSLVEITQEDYDTLTDKDPSTIYLVSNGDKITLYIGGAEVNEIEGIKVNNTTINPDSNKVVNITVPTTAADISALPDTTKYAAALSLTINSLTYVMTGQLKDQNGDNLGTAQTIDLPLESVVVGGSYNSQTKKVVLTLQNGNTIEFSVADLVLGLQTELSASNKLNPAYIDYDSTHRAVSDTEKSTWNNKQNALTTAQLTAVNSGIDSAKVKQIETNKNNISLLSGDISVEFIGTYVSNNKNRIKFNVSATAKDGYTVKETGVIYFNAAAGTPQAELTIENVDGTNIKKARSLSDFYPPALLDNGNGVYARFYTIINDGTNDYVIYATNDAVVYRYDEYVYKAIKVSEALSDTTITSALAETFDMGTIINGYSGDDFPTGLIGKYISVITHGCDISGQKKIQEAIFQTGDRKSRFYDGSSWTVWT